MCKLCAIAARYSRVRQDSLVFNLSQFAVAVEGKPLTENTRRSTRNQISVTET